MRPASTHHGNGALGSDGREAKLQPPELLALEVPSLAEAGWFKLGGANEPSLGGPLKMVALEVVTSG